MPDNEREERKLEEELRELGRGIEYPPAPDISQAVRSRIEDEGGPRPRGIWSRLPSAKWVAAAAIVVVMVSPFFSPAFRGAVSDIFMLGQAAQSGGQSAPESAEPESRSPDSASSSGVAEKEAPTSSRGDPPNSAAEGGMESLRGAERISIEEARTRAGALLLPRSPEFGTPDEAYAPEGVEGYALVYRPRSGLPPPEGTDVGLILTVAPGDVESVYFGGGVRGESVIVDGGRGYWNPAEGTLFWKTEGHAIRLDSGLPKSGAIEVAESVR